MDPNLTHKLERLETRIKHLTAKVTEFAAKSYYSPDQERDADGKWGDGGGGGGGGGSKRERERETERETERMKAWSINHIKSGGRVMNRSLDKLEKLDPKSLQDSQLESRYDRILDIQMIANDFLRDARASTYPAFDPETKRELVGVLKGITRRVGRLGTTFGREMESRRL